MSSATVANLMRGHARASPSSTRAQTHWRGVARHRPKDASMRGRLMQDPVAPQAAHRRGVKADGKKDEATADDF